MQFGVAGLIKGLGGGNDVQGERSLHWGGDRPDQASRGKWGPSLARQGLTGLMQATRSWWGPNLGHRPHSWDLHYPRKQVSQVGTEPTWQLLAMAPLTNPLRAGQSSAFYKGFSPDHVTAPSTC